MDITDTLAPKSDQLDAVDLLSGPQTFTVERVTKGNAEQPINVHLAEFPRPWRPGVNQRRVLGYIWGTNSEPWAGRRVTLRYDPDVVYGGKKVGGVRITHMSNITERTGAPIIPTRGKSEIYYVDPLPDAASARQTAPSTSAIATCTDIDQLGAWWKQHPDQRQGIEARVEEIKAANAGESA